MPSFSTRSIAPTRILVPVDFSSSSDTAFATASEMARLFHADLCLLHVVPMFPDFTDTDCYPEDRARENEERRASERLAVMQEKLLASGVTTTTRVEVGNDVVSNIMLAITAEGADMVILSTHGMSGWREVVFGSIAEKVVKLVQCPILLLHSAPVPRSAEARSYSAGVLATRSGTAVL